MLKLTIFQKSRLNQPTNASPVNYHRTNNPSTLNGTPSAINGTPSANHQSQVQ